MEIKITKTTTPKEKPQGPLGFGKYFTDHMFVMDYTTEKGCTMPKLFRFLDLVLHPKSLFYAVINDFTN